MSGSSKLGHGLAKVLGIKLGDPNAPEGIDKTTRGESVFSVDTADTDAFYEPEATTAEWLGQFKPTGRGIAHYFYSLVPFTHWIGHYNWQWAVGDLVAGITVGAVVVPQGMAYALLAGLPAEYGLYSSFMGVLIYWFFATSKDITIGPVAVVSTLVGTILADLKKKKNPTPGPVLASAMAVISGSIVLFIGLIRCGWIVDFIPLTAISAFMTGSAINIAAGQVPGLMGITGFNTRDATYKVIINTLKGLPRTQLDAAMGLTALFLLYAIRFTCNQLAKRFPSKRKTFFFISTLRTAFTILLYTMISWLVNRHHRKKPLFKILSTVPRGFKHVGTPVITKDIIKPWAGKIPVLVIVLLIEHIAISKSFGRVNNYTINPSQELLAIGITNVFAPFFGAYPATGSFSRTAIKSKAGVRTPFAGVITAVIVLLAIYALTAVFFYIPNASLSAVIIHAVGDLITPPNVVYRFWRVNPIEVIIFFAGVFVTIFSSIENGIYTTVAVSAAVLLFRVVKARGRFLGRTKIHSVIGDHHLAGGDNNGKYGSLGGQNTGSKKNLDKDTSRSIFLPIDHNDGSNPSVTVEGVAPGVFIYRFSEGFNYPNANHYLDHLTETIFEQTQRTNPNSYARLGDRPWNDPAPRKFKGGDESDNRPHLKAIILDFSSVNNVDVTAVQNLIDVRNQLDRYASPDVVEWHFASINNRWTKRALVSGGFGYPSNNHISNPDGTSVVRRWKPIFDVAEIGGLSSAAEDGERRQQKEDVERQHSVAVGGITQADTGKEVTEGHTIETAPTRGGRYAVVAGINRPFFHPDLNSAVSSVLENLENRPEVHSNVTQVAASKDVDSESN